MRTSVGSVRRTIVIARPLVLSLVICLYLAKPSAGQCRLTAVHDVADQ